MTRHTPDSVMDGIRFAASPAGLRAPLVEVVTAIHRHPPSTQVLAAAATLVCFADAIGADPHDIVARVRRMQADIDGPFSVHWQGMKDYAKEELLK